MSAVRRSLAGCIAAVAVALGVFLPSTTTATADVRPSQPAAMSQSDQPAPQSREKRVIGAVHSDAVSVFIDDGHLALDSAADIDIDGDGIIDLGSRTPADGTLFHLASSSRAVVPDAPAYRFLGEPGSPLWLAPQTQNHALLWPGFSTEHGSLAGRIGENSIALRLVNVDGPGDVEVYLQNGATVERTFSSTEELGPWITGVPQHTHMNWAFTAAGTYSLTFEATASVGGAPQVTRNTYTFVVGEMAGHQVATATTLFAPSSSPTGEPVTLDATVAPERVIGSVQFADAATGAVLGHAPVESGGASFTTSSLPPGEHRLTAEFVPTWSSDFGASTSAEAMIVVDGEVRPRPAHEDTEPVAESEFSSGEASTVVRVESTDRTVRAGSTLAVSVTGHGGEWVSIWIPELTPAWQGWTQADLADRASIPIVASAKPGSYRVAVKTEDGAYVGWDQFTVEAPDASGPLTPAPPTPPVEPPAPVPVAASQQCAPVVILENGHVDAFNVSAGAGRAVLQVKEDVTGHNVFREVETVLLRVKQSAYRADIPAGTPGAPSGYVLPLTQDSRLLWPGWDTNRTAASGYSDVTIHITSVDGPGNVTLSSQGSFGDVTPLLQNGGYQLPGALRERIPAHTHAQWTFSDAGIYKLRVHATATNPSSGQSLETAPHTYVFQVGGVPLGDTFCGLSSAGAADSAAVADAVDKAAAEAAAQAAEAEAAIAQTHLETLGRGAAVQDVLTESVSSPAGDGAVVALIAGGALVVGGVVGMTVRYLRRIRHDELRLLSGSAA